VDGFAVDPMIIDLCVIVALVDLIETFIEKLLGDKGLF
jgi:hypothetical protein